MPLTSHTSDAALQAQLAERVRNARKASPASFSRLNEETESLHLTLEIIDRELGSGEGLSASQRRRFNHLLNGCGVVLKDLEGLLESHDRPNSQRRKSRDRIGDLSTGADELCTRMKIQACLLNSFRQTNQVMVSQSLDSLSFQVQNGKYSAPELYRCSLAGQEQVWKALREPLTSVGITLAAFEENSSFIFDYVRNAFAPGGNTRTSDGSADVGRVSFGSARSARTSWGTRKLTKKATATSTPFPTSPSSQEILDKSHKVLVLGISEAGKTTVLNQIRLLSSSPFHTGQKDDSGEYGDYREIWWETLVHDFRLILDYLQLDQQTCSFNEPKVKAAMESVYEASSRMDGLTMFPWTVMDAFHSLWDEAAIRNIVRQGLNIGLNSNLEYLYKNMERIADPRDRPSNEDVLNVRVLTLGVSKTVVTSGCESCSIYDVPRERGGRTKWSHAFNGRPTRCVILVASLMGYCSGVESQTAGPTSNQLCEALAVTDSLMGHERLSGATFILHLTKLDRFRRTMKNYPLNDYDAEFSHPPKDENYTAQGLAFIANKFVALAKKHSRALQVHCINATSASSRGCLRKSLTFISETPPTTRWSRSGRLLPCPHCHMRDLFDGDHFEVPYPTPSWSRDGNAEDSSESSDEHDEHDETMDSDNAPAYSWVTREEATEQATASGSEVPSLTEYELIDWSGVQVEELRTSTIS